jgi:hypothetical protein
MNFIISEGISSDIPEGFVCKILDGNCVVATDDRK